MRGAFHFNLDHAWDVSALGLETIDVMEWGPRLRFSAPKREIESFYQSFEDRIGCFTLFGSGDFHHLSALWLRRVREPFVLVSFDNHPDWDVRPPHWACGGWINRALELPLLQKASIWGCGNFECWGPARFFGNRGAEREGKLEVRAWGENRPKRSGVIFLANWREDFERFAAELREQNIYITIDLDCLRAQDAITNWENGKFVTDDVVWALGKLRESARVVGGDICGAFSPPKYARSKQRFVAEWDHPKINVASAEEARRINSLALEKLWPALTQRNEHEAGGNEQGTYR